MITAKIQIMMLTATKLETPTVTHVQITLETLIGVVATIPTLLTMKKCVALVEAVVLLATATIQAIAVKVAKVEMALEPLMNQLCRL
jgi:hypothetical protein